MISLTEFDKEEQRILDWQEGFEEGLTEALLKLIIILKEKHIDFDTIHAAIVSTPAFSKFSKEEIRNIYDEL